MQQLNRHRGCREQPGGFHTARQAHGQTQARANPGPAGEHGMAHCARQQGWRLFLPLNRPIERILEGLFDPLTRIECGRIRCLIHKKTPLKQQVY
jgi:hypothetical protein